MGDVRPQRDKALSKQEKEKTRREKLAGFFFNLAQLAFAGLVIGWITPLASTTENSQNWVILCGGIAFTTIFAAIGNNILK